MTMSEKKSKMDVESSLKELTLDDNQPVSLEDSGFYSIQQLQQPGTSSTSDDQSQAQSLASLNDSGIDSKEDSQTNIGSSSENMRVKNTRDHYESNGACPKQKPVPDTQMPGWHARNYQDLVAYHAQLDRISHLISEAKNDITRHLQDTTGNVDLSQALKNSDKIFNEAVALKSNGEYIMCKFQIKSSDQRQETTTFETPATKMLTEVVTSKASYPTYPPQNGKEHTLADPWKQDVLYVALPTKSQRNTDIPIPPVEDVHQHTTETPGMLKKTSSGLDDGDVDMLPVAQHTTDTPGMLKKTSCGLDDGDVKMLSVAQDGLDTQEVLESMYTTGSNVDMYEDESSPESIAEARAPENNGNPPHKHSFIQSREPSFQDDMSHHPLQNRAAVSPRGRIPLWDIRHTRYDKGTSFKSAEVLFSFSRSVGIIVKKNRLWGTCARYGQRHVMTCQHVASPEHANLDDPSDAFVEFNYYNEWPPQSPVRLPIKCIDYNCRSRSLDFCLLCLNIQDSRIQEIRSITPLGPYVQQGSLPVEVERVTLIGHPQGVRKSFDYNCPVLDWHQSAQYTGQISNDEENSSMFDANRINYRSTFWSGSSGSPVVAIFDDNVDNLQIVAMHTQGYPTGQPCEVEQGVKMSAIQDEVKTYRPDLYDELFT